MSTTRASTEDHDKPWLYEIRLQGHLDDRWAAWFEGLILTREDNGETLLTGPVVDQAALHGLLRKVRDVGMPLLSLTRVRTDQVDASGVKDCVEASGEDQEVCLRYISSLFSNHRSI